MTAMKCVEQIIFVFVKNRMDYLNENLALIRAAN